MKEIVSITPEVCFKTTYRAFDGQEFEDRVNCEAYENSLLNEKWSDRIIALDKNCERQNLLEWWNHAILFIREDDTEAYKIYRSFSDENVPIPDGPGLWVYDSDKDEWYSWHEKMEEVKKETALLIQCKTTIEKLTTKD